MSQWEERIPSSPEGHCTLKICFLSENHLQPVSSRSVSALGLGPVTTNIRCCNPNSVHIPGSNFVLPPWIGIWALSDSTICGAYGREIKALETQSKREPNATVTGRGLDWSLAPSGQEFPPLTQGSPAPRRQRFTQQSTWLPTVGRESPCGSKHLLEDKWGKKLPWFSEFNALHSPLS